MSIGPTDRFPGMDCSLPSRFWKVAHGMDGWTPQEEAHLRTCPHCAQTVMRIAEAIDTAHRPASAWYLRALSRLWAFLFTRATC
jgi:hypothetical protein